MAKLYTIVGEKQVNPELDAKFSVYNGEEPTGTNIIENLTGKEVLGKYGDVINMVLKDRNTQKATLVVKLD